VPFSKEVCKVLMPSVMEVLKTCLPERSNISNKPVPVSFSMAMLNAPFEGFG